LLLQLPFSSSLVDDGHLEIQDDCPYEAERQLRVSLNDIFRSDVHQTDVPPPQELQTVLDVLYAVEASGAVLSVLKRNL